MAIFKCKSCGGSLEIKEGDSVAVCEYCNNPQTLPRLDSEKKVTLYDRANHFRRNNEFDKAMSIYEQILNEDTSDAEAYWSLVLCRYGIEYVEDPATHKRIPTVNRTQPTSIYADENYKAAIANADLLQREIYEAEAKAIDEIQKGILAISEKEKPFDIFICYKETDANGQRTRDSVLANDIYHLLSNEGYKVFFSRITLEDKLGSAYEPYIFAALHSAKVMVVLGTKKEYFHAPWVMNEWKRFQALIQSGEEKTLIPAYRDMDPYDLPEEFSFLQALDMSKLGFMQDLLHGIRKIVPVNGSKAAAGSDASSAGDANSQALLKRAFLFLEDRNWKSADEYCEKVLDTNPENAQAYLGKLLAELRVSNREQLKRMSTPFDDRANYKNTLRFADPELANFLQRTVSDIRERNEAERVAGIYEDGVSKMRSAHTESAFRSAAVAFGKIIGYKDAETLANQCLAQAETCRKDEVYAKAIQQATTAKYSSLQQGIEAHLSAIRSMESISGWRDADQKIVEFQKDLEELRVREKEEIALAEAERRAEEKRRQAELDREKRKRTVRKAKKLIKRAVILGAIVAFVFGVIWPKMIRPNLSTDDIYSPEIVRTYSGTVDKSTRYETDKWNHIFTILSCEESGEVTATWEFMHNGNYGKYHLTGQIVDKKNNGNIKIEFTATSWEVQPEGYEWTSNFTAEISDHATTWYGDGVTLSAGTSDSYDIKTASDFRKLTNSDGLYILKNDIDLGGSDWTPIEGFSGTLIGNGFTIKNLTIESSADNIGFFATLDGFVSSLNFENAKVKVSGRKENIGILCGSLNGTAVNISTSGSVEAPIGTNVGGIIGKVVNEGSYALASLKNTATVSGNEKVGGVIGSAEDSISKYDSFTVTMHGLENTASVTASGAYVGGIAGYVFLDNTNGSSYHITLHAAELVNTGHVKGSSFAGGIFGYAGTDSTESYLQDSSNASAVTAECYVGAVAGQLYYITLDSCKNDGSTVSGTGYYAENGEKYAFVGGFVGRGYLANSCTNTVEIAYDGGGAYVGGIIGYTDAIGSYTMSGLKNTAAISGNDCVGGIIGGMANIVSKYDNYTVSMSGMENTASVTASGDYAGGIVGYLFLENTNGSYTVALYATELANTGDIKGNAYVGGIFGYAGTDSEESYLQDSSNASAVTAEYYVGAVAGQLEIIKLYSCKNNGSTVSATGYEVVDGEKYAFVGGFVGRGYTADACTNTVEIAYDAGGAYVGGIMGYTDAAGEYSMSVLKNTADISGNNYVGGIFGGMENRVDKYSNYTVSLHTFENTGSITASGNYVGGIAGSLDFGNSCGKNYSVTLYATAMTNSGNVKGNSYVGGIFGYAKTDSENSSMTDTNATGEVSGKSSGTVNGKAENLTEK
ncbi:MAG: TIR domain-containing protein [Oscillospiraceae bacterium]|nr:TIR domain-containing protein [Oscillospiraceae bacterium]